MIQKDGMELTILKVEVRDAVMLPQERSKGTTLQHKDSSCADCCSLSKELGVAKQMLECAWLLSSRNSRASYHRVILLSSDDSPNVGRMWEKLMVEQRVA